MAGGKRSRVDFPSAIRVCNQMIKGAGLMPAPLKFDEFEVNSPQFPKLSVIPAQKPRQFTLDLYLPGLINLRFVTRISRIQSHHAIFSPKIF